MNLLFLKNKIIANEPDQKEDIINEMSKNYQKK